MSDSAPSEPPLRSAARDLFDEILGAGDRDHGFSPRPVISCREDDDPAFLDQIDRKAGARIPISRRGAWHGQWAELRHEEGAATGARAGGRPGTTEARERARRWHAARPIVARVLEPGVLEGPELIEALDRHRGLSAANGLRQFLRRRMSELRPEFDLRGRPGTLADPERDIERVMIHWQSSAAEVTGRRRGRKVNNLWIKTGWLSPHADDRSLRMRFSFGREGPDDANRDELRQNLVARLAQRLLPEMDLIEGSSLPALLELLSGEPVSFTQHIAYWNAPEGGSLFHHDAFDEDPLGRQLGVAFVQLVGRTAWLAASLSDLAGRVREFLGFLEEGELPWVRAQLYPEPGDFERVSRLAGQKRDLERELSLPGSGCLSSLVNRGPEFTAFLLDAGHGVLLEPGEAILLPNQGLRATAMHSVFCASDSMTYGLSLAVRGRRPAPIEVPVDAQDETPAETARRRPPRMRSRRRPHQGPRG